MAPLLKKEDGLIDWNLAAVELHNRVRGLTPWPGAYTFLEGALVKILGTEIVPGSREPGAIHSTGGTLDVGTGRDVLRIVTLQPAGKKRMSASEFLRGHRGISGKKFRSANI
jgi:methionyl-tRNA formyltransferase